jgi:hypothetical protein
MGFELFNEVRIRGNPAGFKLPLSSSNSIGQFLLRLKIEKIKK